MAGSFKSILITSMVLVVTGIASAIFIIAMRGNPMEAVTSADIAVAASSQFNTAFITASLVVIMLLIVGGFALYNPRQKVSAVGLIPLTSWVIESKKKPPVTNGKMGIFLTKEK